MSRFEGGAEFSSWNRPGRLVNTRPAAGLEMVRERWWVSGCFLDATVLGLFSVFVVRALVV